MRIYNARIFQPETGCKTGSIEIKDGKILKVFLDTAYDQPGTGDIDARDLILSPGWIDLQINGGFGKDFTSDPTSVWEVGAQLPRYGVTGFLPTIITSPREVYQQAIDVLRQGPPAGYCGAHPFGYHFEGPFLNMGKKGAHNPASIHQPDADFASDWSRENGVMLVTMAPELPGALDLARKLHTRGIILSAGHSLATLEDSLHAIDAGYSASTHLFNAMPPLDHRSPGLVTASLLDKRITPSIIVDGIHVHPKMVELAWRMRGAEGIALITDAVGALGMPPGRIIQGGMVVIVGEDAARLIDGTLAASILSMEKALQNIMVFTGDSIEKILPALSTTQAKLLRLDDVGAIQPGYLADFTLINDQGQVQMTIIGGEVVYSKP